LWRKFIGTTWFSASSTSCFLRATPSRDAKNFSLFLELSPSDLPKATQNTISNKNMFVTLVVFTSLVSQALCQLPGLHTGSTSTGEFIGGKNTMKLDGSGSPRIDLSAKYQVNQVVLQLLSVLSISVF